VNAPEDVRSKALAPHQRVVATKGPATGRITGINHMQLVVLDMDASVRFYRDILGFTVIRTLGIDYSPVGSTTVSDWRVPHDYFVQLPGGTCLSLIEVEGAKRPQHSIWVPSFWPGENAPPHAPEKLDHFAFDVPTFEDLVWFQRHLRDNGVAVSDIVPRSKPPRFVDSIYFNDPSGIPLEIATWNRSDPLWKKQRPEDWYSDTDPVPSLLA